MASNITVFTNAHAILPDVIVHNATIVCVDGRIDSISTATKTPSGAQVIDAKGNYLCPGFIDIHVHGGQGSDFMDGDLVAVQTICRAHARHGTTTLFPTTTTGTPEQIGAMLNACSQYQREYQAHSGARIEGVHLYGPYFAKEKTGCHAPQHCREPHQQEYAAYFKSGLIRIATCAAELEGAAEFYRFAKRHKCLITCGHSNASWTEMANAFKAGMRHVDHFWCAMSMVNTVRTRLGVPMQGSMLEYVLANPEMSTEVIADGCHLAPELLQFAYQMKGPQRLCLVTDCSRALDMPAGEYRFGSCVDGPTFRSDGKVGWAANGSLASSVAGMDHIVRQMKRDTSASLPEIIRMATLTPAERAGIADSRGSLEVGKHADILILNRRLQIQNVWIAGTQFNRRTSTALRSR
jgi:N-acetylglucosamine-6-phosphate deacetylase